ncbi:MULTISPECIES: alpha/beta hydrolase [Bifidobacterium]|uniref:PGAP1-like alpha/beta domain-containing protein n=1 Tax=Bifidobacterium TaxID=1678 RepID=UPI0018DBB3B9|nr:MULTISPECIES: alpha/beta hydrolase [Bifidobacterium]MBH9979840.1 hypothetical protein [Bifidobacterium asteroides]MBI0098916.1 hypothetical protein [Bifidobacterium sp. W8114]
MKRTITAAPDTNGYTRTELEHLTGMADRLNQAGGALATLQSQWILTNQAIRRTTPGLPTLICTQTALPPPGHAHLPLDLMVSFCSDQAQACEDLRTRLQSVADRLTKAYGLYSQAESFMDRLMGSLTSKALTVFRPIAPFMLGSIGLGLGVAKLTDHLDASQLQEFLETTASIQQPLLTAVASGLSSDHHDPIGGLVTGPGLLMPLILAHFQGDRIVMDPVHPQGKGLGEAHDIAGALHNLETLGSCRDGIPYATIAVQRYRKADGKNHWLVYIPGTSSHLDSPIGWAQNIQLMSDKAAVRGRAASMRLVDQAMRDAGVRPDDPVSLVGHSQGGIVAATMASDLSDRYSFNHVVTVGSPIAHRRIKSDTWVTSVEMREELVSSLDGADNPSRPNQLTVRGRAGGPPPPGGNQTGRTVTTAEPGKESTHGMAYQQAAWADARDQNSPAVRRQDDHFAQAIDGDLQETRYYRGRLRR